MDRDAMRTNARLPIKAKGGPEPPDKSTLASCQSCPDQTGARRISRI